MEVECGSKKGNKIMGWSLLLSPRNLRTPNIFYPQVFDTPPRRQRHCSQFFRISITRTRVVELCQLLLLFQMSDC